MSVYAIYITAGDKAEAEKLAAALLEEGLIACGNVMEGVTSVFRWQGAVQTESESLLIAKTTEACLDRLVERVQALHSYNCPCLTAWPIQHGNPEYLQWVQEETR